MANSLDDVIAQMRQYGVEPTDRCDLSAAFTKYYRWRPKCETKAKKSAWARLFEYRSPNGKLFITGAFGWRNDTWEVEATPTDWTPAERAEWIQLRKAAAKAAEEERAKDAETAAQKALKIWERAREEGASPYLTRKKVRAFGTRFMREMLLVPMRGMDGTLHGLQYIGDDKKFGSGTVKEGHFHTVGVVDPAKPLGFAEGYATAASVHMATGWPVVVCFDAGNLEHVVAKWRALYAELQFLMLADDDRHLMRRLCERLKKLGIATTPDELGKLDQDSYEWEVPGAGPDGGALMVLLRAGWSKDSAGVPCITGSITTSGASAPLVLGPDAEGKQVSIGVPSEGRTEVLRLENAGRARAELAAKKHKARVFLPVFADVASAGTDWNDLHVAEGLEACTAQLLQAFGAPPVERGGAARGGRKGRGGDDREPPGAADGTASAFMSRYTLIYGSTLVWDEQLRTLIKIESLKLAHERLTKWWLGQDDRKMVPQANVVFDPTCDQRAPEYVNLFDRLPLVPKAGECDLIIEHLFNLCSKREGLAHWLTCWLALPLQKPGTKMRTAIVLHGRTEGTGKSRLMDVMRMLYGAYSRSVTQLQLQSEFTGWLSCMLYIVAEEVVNAQDREHHQGLLQNLITAPVVQINEKNMPLRQEANYANLAFLSNKNHPVKLNPSDRRYTVIHVEQEQDKAYFDALSDQINSGGAEAFLDYLLQYDLKGFTAFTRPYKNKDRLHLITLSMTSDQRFFEYWRTGLAGVPFCSCAAKDLFRAYQAWCKVSGERFTVNMTMFGRMASDELERLKAPPKKKKRYSAWSDRQVEEGDFSVDSIKPSQQGVLYFVKPGERTEDELPDGDDAAEPIDPDPFSDASVARNILRFQEHLHLLIKSARRGL